VLLVILIVTTIMLIILTIHATDRHMQPFVGGAFLASPAWIIITIIIVTIHHHHPIIITTTIPTHRDVEPLVLGDLLGLLVLGLHEEPLLAGPHRRREANQALRTPQHLRKPLWNHRIRLWHDSFP
jgi:heme/copper-type cytochrome/quinol oxidase subunit 2